MDWLTEMLDNSQWPVWSALLLGLMTALSPCSLITNVSAIGFLARNIGDRRKVLLRGLAYTLGLVFTYSLIGLLLWLGLDKTDLPGFFQRMGGKIIGPVLLVIGLFLLGAFRLRMPVAGKVAEWSEKHAGNGLPGAFLLGALFALAFCPYTGLLYFAIMMPLVLSTAGGLALPVIFGVAAGIPILLFAWLIAYALGTIGKVYSRIRIFEKRFRMVVALLFIATGVWFIILMIISGINPEA